MSELLDLIIGAVAEPATSALIHFLWQGSLIALALGIVLLVLGRKSADLRYRCACWALLLMVLLPIGTAVRHAHQNSPAKVHAREAVAAVADESAPVNTTATIKQLAKATDSTPVTSRIAGTLLRQVAWRPEQAGTARWILGIWLGGIFLLSAVHIGGWFQVQKLRTTAVESAPEDWQDRADQLCRRLGIDRPVRILCSAAVEVPMVIGWLKPVVLIPAGTLLGLPIQQFESILAHELAHIWRRDYLVNLLQITAETLLFYHPAVWWVSRQIRAERENCCDDIAVELSGNKLAYARALIDLEELRHAAPRLALGASDGSLVKRVKRLVGGPEMSTNSNRSLMVGTLAAMGILVCGAVMALAAQQQIGEAMTLASNVTSEQVSVSGTWSAERDDDTLYFEIRERGRGHRKHNSRFNMTLHADPDDFTGLSYTEDVTFRLTREAGEFVFTGDFEGRAKDAEGYGKFTFTPDSRYVSRMARLGTDDIDDDAMIVLAAQDLRVKDVEELRDAGYGPFDGDELITIAIFDVTPEYIDEMEGLGYKDIDMDTLVALRVHDVSPAYVESMHEAGVDAESVDDMLSWKIHGVDVEYMADIRAEFGHDMSHDDILAFKIHGVDHDFAHEIEEAGFGDLDSDELLAWKIHGIHGEYIENIREEFGHDLHADDIMSWKIHGVDSDYIDEIKDLGYELDNDDLLSWKIHGVDADFIDGLAQLGYKDIDAEDLISMRIHGADPRWIKRLHDRGLDDLDVDDLIRLRISGVEF
jgi:bla regulator protein blaR1